MGTISNSLSSTSTSSSSTSTSTSGIFTGSSSYSKDFQNVINRAVAIASLPVNLLTSQQSALTAQSNEISTLDTAFTGLQAAIQNIQDALGGAGMQTTLSAPSVASLTLGEGAVEGSYSVNVTNIGSYATSLSAQSWNEASDPSGKPSSYALSIGGKTYTIAPTHNTISSVVSAISSQYGNLVKATAVNVGTSNSPDFRISLKSVTLGPQELKISVPAQAGLQWSRPAASGRAISQSAYEWDASGDPSSYTLLVDDASYTINPTDNSAASVAAAINALSGNPVQAMVIDVGTSDSHDYRIQLQSNSANALNVDLQDAWGNGLQQQQTPAEAGAAISRTAWSWDASTDSAGDPTEYTLTLGDTQQTFTVDDNSASGVASAINGLYAGVQASVVDLGTAGTHDYRIQLTGDAAHGPMPQLTRNTSFELQAQGQPPGELARYEVSNSGVTVSSDSRSVNLATGTTMTLQSTGMADMTVIRSTAALGTALSSFADAYNAAGKELASQRGSAGGALQGNFLVVQLAQALSGISTFATGDGQVNTLASLGLSLGTDGKLTFNPYTLMATDIGNSAGVTAFLGSVKDGGFLKAASEGLDRVQNSSKGLLKRAEADSQARLSSLADTISHKQDKITQLRLRLQNQMAAADALIATMEQQYSYMAGMFAAMDTSKQAYAKG